MNGRYEITDPADSDLLEIASYIGRQSPASAERFIDRIYETLRRLAHSPQMGRLRPDLAPALRSFPVANYVIFYRPIEGGIEVIRVLHGARDIDSLFNP